MRRRSNLMVLLGIAFFVVGGLVVYLVTQDDGDDGDSAAPPMRVLVAAEDISAGALGSELVASDAVRVVEVDPADAVPGALQSAAQLEGATLTQGYGADQQITAAGVHSRNRTYEIPEGHEAVAVALDFVPGGAEYVHAGDHINLYGLFEPPDGAGEAFAQLLLSNVEVLDVNRTTAPLRGSAAAAASDDPTAPAPGRASGGSIEFLLALTPVDVERVVYSTEHQKLYVSLVGDDAPAVSGTPGRSFGTVLG